MTDNRIRFGAFDVPILRGLKYLSDGQESDRSYLFVNDPHNRFSMYFESGMPRFTPPRDQHLQRDYFQFEIKRMNRTIQFFCPEKRKNLNSVVWYFCLELFDKEGKRYSLPGQVHLHPEEHSFYEIKHTPAFIRILDKIDLNREAITSQIGLQDERRI